MGQFWTGSRVSLRLTELPFLSNLKMSPFLILSLAVSACVARPQSPSLPAGLSIAQCVNYPFCDQTNGFLEIPAVPGAEAVIRAQENIIVGNQSPLSALPGIEAHAAAEAAVQDASRPGFPAHAAAVNAVLLAQGRVPEGIPASHLAHFQAEQAVLLAQG